MKRLLSLFLAALFVIGSFSYSFAVTNNASPSKIIPVEDTNNKLILNLENNFENESNPFELVFTNSKANIVIPSKSLYSFSSLPNKITVDLLSKSSFSLDFGVDSYCVTGINIIFPYENIGDIAKLSVSVTEPSGDVRPVSGFKYDETLKILTIPCYVNGTYTIKYTDKTMEDLEDAWSYNDIVYLTQKGIISGTSPNTFEPRKNIKRADAFLLIMRAVNACGKQGEDFSDTKDNYYSYMLRIAKEMGLAKGTDNNTFEPNSNIIRQDFFLLISRILDIYYENQLDYAKTDEIEDYIDKDKIDSYALESMCRLVKADILKGDDTKMLNPKANITRQEAAVIISRILNFTKDNLDNLTENANYYYSYPVEQSFSGNTFNSDLLNGKNPYPDNENNILIAKAVNTSVGRTNWNGESSTDYMFSDKPAHFYIKTDIGFVSKVSEVSITVKADSLPDYIELFYGNDGMNYNFCLENPTLTSYNGDFATYKLKLAVPADVKNMKAVFYADEGKEIKITEFSLKGKKTAEKILLSQNCPYDFEGSSSSSLGNYQDDGYKLTDGIFGKCIPNDSSFTASAKRNTDEVSGQNAQIITIDLKEEKNVSEILLSAFARANGSAYDYITVYTSNDDKEYSDFSMSYPAGIYNEDENKRITYVAGRNHTVKARFVKIVAITSSTRIPIDEIQVFGSETEIKEPEYDYTNEYNFVYDTNLNKSSKIYANGKATSRLNDDYVSAPKQMCETITFKDGKAIIDINLENASDFINSFKLSAIECKDNIEKIEVQSSQDGTNYETVGFMQEELSYLTNKNYSLILNKFISGKNIRYIIYSSASAINVSEVMVYEKQGNIPMIKGGFIGFFADIGPNYNAHQRFDDYYIYLQMKGYKELGMDTFVIPSGLSAIPNSPKVSLAPVDPILEKAGFRQSQGYGTKDVIKAYLEAGDKLGLKLFLCTTNTYTYDEIKDSSGNPLSYEKKMEFCDTPIYYAKLIVDRYNQLYSKYKSFYGLYLQDETCDEWLQNRQEYVNGQRINGGLNYYRKLYKGQSDYIHEVMPDKKIMICPAIWRCGTPMQLKSNIFDLINNGDERPVVDIVAAQDCLGRIMEITVPDNIYASYQEYSQQCKIGTENAGAQYWVDAEVFDVTYANKTAPEVKKSLSIMSAYTNGTILYDLPHYFNYSTKGSINSFAFFEAEYGMTEYIKYYNKNVKYNVKYLYN